MTTETNPTPETPNPVDSVTAVDAPPEDFGPKPPAGYAPRDGAVILHHRAPTHAQLVAAPGAVVEIRNESAFHTAFGQSTTTASDLANALFVAYAWSMTAKNAKSYLGYVREQEQKAWTHAWALLGAFRPVFIAALAANGALRAMFQALSQFFGARSAVARKAGATRAANKAAKEAAAAAAAAEAGSHAATPAAAPSAPASTPVTTPSASAIVANDNPHNGGATTPNVHAA